jgi:hypothetical protein
VFWRALLAGYLLATGMLRVNATMILPVFITPKSLCKNWPGVELRLFARRPYS